MLADGKPCQLTCSLMPSLALQVVLGAAIVIGGSLLAAGWWWNRRKRLLKGKI